jgi:UDP-N-acetylglucosamine 2-epimerase (non-hydrolysing)
MKIAPLFHALHETDWANPCVIHTGQHYDKNMSDVFFDELGLPAPEYHLGVGSGTHAEQTGNVMIAYEKVCMDDRPDWTIVVGDVNSTVACAMVCAKLWIPVAHLEAGLRSGDRRMPEEINRLMTDAIADLLWTPSADADANLLREGADASKIDRVGNIMIDSLELMRPSIETDSTRKDKGLNAGAYALVTLHRPSNVDQRESLEPVVNALAGIAGNLPVVFVAHPRTMNSLKTLGLLDRLESEAGIILLEPLPYVSFMNLVFGAKCVITDSGGLQEETTYLDIPCLTLRENTERPITIEMGSNRLVNAHTLSTALARVLEDDWPSGRCPPLWDGATAIRTVESLRRRLK